MLILGHTVGDFLFIEIKAPDSSQDEAGDYYGELSSGNKLPNRINFITSCYFAGVDIEDYYHLNIVTPSNTRIEPPFLALHPGMEYLLGS